MTTHHAAALAHAAYSLAAAVLFAALVLHLHSLLPEWVWVR